MPLPLIVAALAPLLIRLVPDLAQSLGGDRASAVVAQAGAVLRQVLGTDDPAKVEAAVADPAKAAEVQIALARLAFDERAAERQAELDALRAEFADTASARTQTVALAQAGSAIAWGAPIVSGIVLGGFAAMLHTVLTQSLPAGAEQMANLLLGTLATMAVTVVGYWCGSSAGSRAKDTTIAEAAQSLARSAPVEGITWGR
jgi:hypothetical protein